jgi:CHAT domain-containing protein
VGSAGDLVPREGEPPLGTGTLLGGDVDLDAAVSGRAGATPRSERFIPLPGSAAEVAALAPRAPAPALSLRGGEATEAGFRAAAPGRRWVHVATHGFARLREDVGPSLAPRRRGDRWLGGDLERHVAGYDPMALAGLALAGANPRDGGGGDDGILTALEVSALDLDGVGLVTLSACQTASGDAADGEGVIGLVAGFQMAGALSVVASLWNVDDEATRLLMERFAALHLDPADPRPPSEALRRASLWLRDAKPGGRDRSAPRLWGAFVCYERR